MARLFLAAAGPAPVAKKPTALDEAGALLRGSDVGARCLSCLTVALQPLSLATAPGMPQVRISRKRILESAAKVFEMYGTSRAVLEIEYFGEVWECISPWACVSSTSERLVCCMPWIIAI